MANGGGDYSCVSCRIRSHFPIPQDPQKSHQVHSQIGVSTQLKKLVENEAHSQGELPMFVRRSRHMRVVWKRLTEQILHCNHSHQVALFGIHPSQPKATNMLITLNDAEFGELKKTINGTGGFQDFLKQIRQRAAIRGGKLELTPDDIDKIRRYAFGYKDGGYEGRLRRIFERHLGPELRG
jgi:hypothetical protein